MKRLILLLVLTMLFLSGCTKQENEKSASSADWTIALSDIGTEPTFIDGKIGDTPAQVIAIRDEDGSVRLSYNTCQVCQGSPWAYFEMENGKLVCQNCGNHFDTDAIGKGGYGCMPMMVPAYTLNSDSVVITADTLSAVEEAFANWKVFP